MRLLLDENLSYRIVTQLQDAGHDAVHVSSVGLTDTADDVIFAWASREDRVVVTADADFGEMLAVVGAVAPSVVQLRSADHLTPSEQGELIIAAIAEVAEDLEAGAVASVRPGRVRIRPLPIERGNDVPDQL
jgi:predicted nuclease of predicted toxin-antitoxin system